MPENQIEDSEVSKKRELFDPQGEMRLSRACCGDLYIIGRLWIEALKTGLLGSKWTVIPVVEAAEPVVYPEKPPPMRYKELPLYQSPHYEYKDHLECQEQCPQRNVKLVHEALYPYVRNFRKYSQQTCCEVTCEFNSYKKDICSSLCKQSSNFKAYMRDPENLTMRQVVVALGGLTGLFIGRSRGLPSKIFTTGLGLLAAGSLCFPKDTDEAFRTFTYHSSKIVIALYNSYCGKNFGLRNKLSCPPEKVTAEEPPPPVPEKTNVSPPKTNGSPPTK